LACAFTLSDTRHEAGEVAMRGRAGYVIAATALAGGMGLAALILFQQLRGVAGRVTKSTR